MNENRPIIRLTRQRITQRKQSADIYQYSEWNINLTHECSSGRRQLFWRICIQLHYLSYTFSMSQYFFFSLVVQSNEMFENSYFAASLSFLIPHLLHIFLWFQKFKKTILTITSTKLCCKFMNYVLYYINWILRLLQVSTTSSQKAFSSCYSFSGNVQ
jgi:hypothetical protein